MDAVHWYDFAFPILSAVCAFGGAIAGTRVDITWIKRELLRHDTELTRLHSRISKALKS